MLLAVRGVLFEDDEETPLAVDESLPEGEDEAAFAGTSGLSIAESTAEQSAIEASEARERAEREAAAAAERKKQEQARVAAATDCPKAGGQSIRTKSYLLNT